MKKIYLYLLSMIVVSIITYKTGFEDFIILALIVNIGWIIHWESTRMEIRGD